MTRAEFEHTVRAAGAILGVGEIVVIGSQAIHGSAAGPLPDEVTRSAVFCKITRWFRLPVASAFPLVRVLTPPRCLVAF